MPMTGRDWTVSGSCVMRTSALTVEGTDCNTLATSPLLSLLSIKSSKYLFVSFSFAAATPAASKPATGASARTPCPPSPANLSVRNTTVRLEASLAGATGMEAVAFWSPMGATGSARMLERPSTSVKSFMSCALGCRSSPREGASDGRNCRALEAMLDGWPFWGSSFLPESFWGSSLLPESFLPY